MKVLLLLAFIGIVSATHTLTAQNNSEDCRCVHHDGKNYEYGLCDIPEGAALDTCGFGEKGWPTRLKNCSDYVHAILINSGNEVIKERSYYNSFIVLLVYTDSLPKDIILGEISASQLPQLFRNFGDWVEVLNSRFGELKLYFELADYTSYSIVRFRIKFDSLINQKIFLNSFANDFNHNDTNFKSYYSYEIGVSQSMNCMIGGINDEDKSNGKITYNDGILTIPAGSDPKIIENDYMLYDYVSGRIYIPMSEITINRDKIIINTRFLANGIYLFCYRNMMFKFIRE